MNILKWAKQALADTPEEKAKKAARKAASIKKGEELRKSTLNSAATKAGPIGDIARKRKEHDKKLKEIMDSM